MKQIVYILLLICVSCGQSADSKVSKPNSSIQANKEGQDKLIKNALSFINAYVANCNKMNNSKGEIEWVNANKSTSQNFKRELKTIIEKANKIDPELGLEVDPIFDAQDYPDKGFELESFDVHTNYLVIKGKDWPDFKLTIKMVKFNSVWLVDGCGIINIPKDKRITR